MHQTPEEQATDATTSPEILGTLVTLGTDIARLVAENPNAPPDILQQLATSDDIEIRKAVTTNPNTPTEVLLSLAEEFPRQFIQNPLFDLLLLENANFPAEISYWTLLNILKLEELPDFFLSSAAKHSNPEILYMVARHPHTPDKALQEMARRYPKDARLGLTIAKRPNISKKVLLTLVESSAIAVRLYLAKHQAIPRSILEQLANSHEPNVNFQQEIHQKIARNPNTPLAVIQKLLSQGDNQVKQAIAGRFDLPIDMLTELAVDYRVHVMNLLAQNIHISSEVLAELANHHELRVRQMVARHPNTPQALLQDAAKSQELWEYVAQNPSTPADLLEELAQSNQEKILTAIASNPSTPASVLKRIAQKHSHDILIAQHPNVSPELLQDVLWRLAMDERFSVRKYVAKHRHTPVYILQQWVRTEPLLRPWIAQNPNTPMEILEVLARDGSPKIREAVAYNPSTPEYLLARLSQDMEVAIRQAVASNHNTGGRVLEMLAKDGLCSTFVAQNPNSSPETLKYLMGLSGFNWLLLAHPNTSLEMREQLLISLARSYIESERLYAAKHPNTPTQTLIELARDRNQEIRSAALRTLKKLSMRFD